MNVPTPIITMIAGVAIALISFWYGQNHGLLPQATSVNAPEYDNLFDTMVTISTGLFLLVQGVILICAIKFRRPKGDNTDGPPVFGNLSLEILWTGIPVAIVLGLSIYSFEVYAVTGGLDPSAAGDNIIQIARNAGKAIAAPLFSDKLPEDNRLAAGIGSQDPEEDIDLNVDVLGLQYAWIFTYPDTGVVSGDLHVPVDRSVRLHIAAQDVIHAFWVPQFRLKQDAIPGRNTTLQFVAKDEGTYPVICAELCGGYHGAMRTQIVVESPEDFSAWQESMIAEAQPDGSAIAMQTEHLSEGEYVAPYAAEMGASPSALHHLSHHALSDRAM